MRISALRADFSQRLKLPPGVPGDVRRSVLYWPGSTIGNFTPAQARTLLARWGRELGPKGGLLIGVDLKKNSNRLNAAYDDPAGVTAAFNLNLLTRLNRELAANFEVRSFFHRAGYNARRSRIEMHLVSTREQRVVVGGARYTFRRGETIHTENSYKYSRMEFEKLGRAAGFVPVQCWTDDDHLFAVHYLKSSS
jgi:dimethylhistidine N-methyltransferase